MGDFFQGCCKELPNDLLVLLASSSVVSVSPNLQNHLRLGANSIIGKQLGSLVVNAGELVALVESQKPVMTRASTRMAAFKEFCEEDDQPGRAVQVQLVSTFSAPPLPYLATAWNFVVQESAVPMTLMTLVVFRKAKNPTQMQPISQPYQPRMATAAAVQPFQLQQQNGGHVYGLQHLGMPQQYQPPPPQQQQAAYLSQQQQQLYQLQQHQNLLRQQQQFYNMHQNWATQSSLATASFGEVPRPRPSPSQQLPPPLQQQQQQQQQQPRYLPYSGPDYSYADTEYPAWEYGFPGSDPSYDPKPLLSSPIPAHLQAYATASTAHLLDHDLTFDFQTPAPGLPPSSYGSLPPGPFAAQTTAGIQPLPKFPQASEQPVRQEATQPKTKKATDSPLPATTAPAEIHVHPPTPAAPKPKTPRPKKPRTVSEDVNGSVELLTLVADFAHRPQKRKFKKDPQISDTKACTSCGTNTTPEWRKGPSGPKTLCNACGLQYVKIVKTSSGELIERRPSSSDGDVKKAKTKKAKAKKPASSKAKPAAAVFTAPTTVSLDPAVAGYEAEPVEEYSDTDDDSDDEDA